jgi:hypothetical protein
MPPSPRTPATMRSATQCPRTLALLAHIEANRDVWLGWTR